MKNPTLAPKLDALFRSAWACLDSGRDAKGFQLLLEAAEGGCVDAQSGVGFLYDIGRGTVRSRSAALRWYRRAARRGDAVAATNIGILYAEVKNRARARHWLRKACDLGNADALLDLARLEVQAAGRETKAQELLVRLIKRRDVTEGSVEQARAMLNQLRETRGSPELRGGRVRKL